MKTEEVVFRCLGTDIHVKIIFPEEFNRDKRKNLLNEVISLYQKYHKRLSRFDSESELCVLNSNLGNWQQVSKEMFLLLEKVLLHNKQTNGIFDPRILTELENRGYDRDFGLIKEKFELPESSNKFSTSAQSLDREILLEEGKVKLLCKIDLTGFTKGYITDRIADFLKGQKLQNFLVDSGGDIFCYGKNERESEWLASLEGYPEEKILIKLSNRSIATSGISRKRWCCGGREVHHLIDPRMPDRSDFNIRSVSVVGDTVEWSDVWAKTLFILGLGEGMKLAQKKGMAVFFLDSKGDLHITKTSKVYIHKQ